MGLPILLGGGVILALIIALSKKGEAAEVAPRELPEVPGAPPSEDVAPPGIPPEMLPPEDREEPGPSYPTSVAPPGIPPEMLPPEDREPYEEVGPSITPPGIPSAMLPPEDRLEPGVTTIPGVTPGTTPVLVTPSGTILLKSPFAKVPALQWSKFVKAMGKGQEGTITKGARYGIFLFGVLRLADLGLVKNVKRGTYRGQTVWTGTWVSPYSESAFLTSSQLQYRAFVKSNQLYASKYAAARKQSPAIFKINGKQLTLSGFLAFAHLVGFMGAINSLKKKSFKPDTLVAVTKVNGLF